METCLPETWSDHLAQLADVFVDYWDAQSRAFPELYKRQLSKPEWTERFIEYISGTELKPK